jgi:copper chaperone CopZ
MEKTIIEVEGMSCGHCSAAIKNLIEELNGVESADVMLAEGKAIVGFDREKTSPEAIIENINSSETYKARLK